MNTAVIGAPVWNRTSVNRLSGDCSATELQVREWCVRVDSNHGSPACRAGAFATKLRTHEMVRAERIELP